MIADAEILADVDRHILLTEPLLGAPLAAHLRKYAVFDRVGIEEASAPRLRLHLAGPGAGALLESLGVSSLPGTALSFTDADVEGASLRILRIDRLGLPGFDLAPASGAGDALLDILLGAGARPAGGEAFRMLRVEAGIPRFGEDMDVETLPDEANLAARAISYTKGCYTGQETVARIKTYGHVNRRLVGLRSDADLPAGTPLLRAAGDEKPAGRVTSSARSPRFDGTIALGIVARDLAEGPGRLVTADGAAVVVTPIPFVEGALS